MESERGWALGLCVHLLFLALALHIFLPAAFSASNPADELETLINNHRTSNKLPALVDNPGLACISLQYARAFELNCDKVGHEKPPDSALNSTFASSCGVDPSSVVHPTGILLACQSEYVEPSEAFTNLLLPKNGSSIISEKNYTELGVAITGYQGGGPYYWCALFSEGSPNKTFVFATGNATSQPEGCFSGTNEACKSDSSRLKTRTLLTLLMITILSLLLSSPTKTPINHYM